MTSPETNTTPATPPAPAKLKVEYHKDMTVGEVLQANPLAAQVLAAFHLGGCSHCAVSAEETVEQICYGYGIPIEMLLDRLNALPQAK